MVHLQEMKCPYCSGIELQKNGLSINGILNVFAAKCAKNIFSQVIDMKPEKWA